MKKFYLILKYKKQSEISVNETDELNLKKITDFMEKIGIPYKFCKIESETFLSGLYIDKGTLLIDKNQLKYVGDTLHEAGHIALLSPEERISISGKMEGILYPDAVEMMTLAWTYAACLDLNLDPNVVFHPDGYHGGSESLICNFQQGNVIGLPMLQWLGLTYDKIDLAQNKTVAYPEMITWIRQR